MNITVHGASERGAAEHGWLSARHSFSFASWFNPDRMGFGVLRVLNDDRILPAAGFPPHSHRDMEIITIVTSGAVAHKDSMGNEGIVREGEVQVMSAGSGVVHSEYNASETEPLALFQLWIETAQEGVAPRYEQRSFDGSSAETLLVAPLKSSFVSEGKALGIHQDAYITRVRLQKTSPYIYALKNKEHGLYVFVVSGSVSIAHEKLSARDAAALEELGECEIFAEDSADIMVIEVPMQR